MSVRFIGAYVESVLSNREGRESEREEEKSGSGEWLQSKFKFKLLINLKKIFSDLMISVWQESQRYAITPDYFWSHSIFFFKQ